MKISTKIFVVIILLIIDYILISIFIRNQNLEPSISIAIIILVPFVFIINIIIAIVFLFLKKTSLTSIFVVNGLCASAITYYSFGNEMKRQSAIILDSWNFTKNDTIFHLIRLKKRNEFYMSYSVIPGSSGNFIEGKYIREKGAWVLISDTSRMRIEGNNLIGFGKAKDTIGMVKEQ